MNNISSTAKMKQLNFKAKPTENKNEVYPQWRINLAKLGTAGGGVYKNFARDTFIATGIGAGIGACISYKKQSNILKQIANKEVVNKSIGLIDRILKINIVNTLKETKKINIKHMAINAGIVGSIGFGAVWTIANFINDFCFVKELINIFTNKNKK